MKYHTINQASGITFDTKPCRDRHNKPCETVTLLHRSAIDGTAVILRFLVITAPSLDAHGAVRFCDIS